jgi:hypothetical protein
VATAVLAAAMTWSAAARADDDTPADEPAEPSPAQVERATKAYEEGMKHFEAQEYEPALENFRRSYETVASPNSHFMVARTLARLGNNEEAYRELGRTIREADAGGERYADTASAARAKQEEIRPRIGLIAIDAGKLPKGSKVVLEGETIPPEEYGDPVPVLPGDVKLVIELPDGRVVEKKVFVKTGGQKSIRLSKPRPKGEPEETGAYIGREKHLDYLFDLTLGFAYTTIEPPGPPNQGGGPSARLVVQLLPKGIIPGVNDGLGIGAGADIMLLRSVPQHVWIPIYAQWNLFITKELSVMFEPGVAIVTKAGDSTPVTPNIMVGARYLIVGDVLAVTARVGLPMAQVGVSALF